MRSELDDDESGHNDALLSEMPELWNGVAMITSSYSFELSPFGLVVFTVHEFERVPVMDTTCDAQGT